MIKKASPSERSLIKLLQEEYPEAVLIRSAGSRKVDVIFMTIEEGSVKTILFEVKSISGSVFYPSKNIQQTLQHEELLDLKKRGFEVYYAIRFSRRGFRYFCPTNDGKKGFIFEDGKENF